LKITKKELSMSTSLDIMTETNFKKFLEEYKIIKDIINPMVLFEKSSQYYTNFSGKLNRLYDVVLEGEQIINDFSKEEEFLIYKLTKKHIIKLVNKSDDNELIDKWEPIIESIEILNDDDYLYFIIDK
jgi:hypothetical protein